MSTIYQDSVDELEIELEADSNALRSLKNTEPVWYKEKLLFKKKYGRKRFENFGVPTNTIGLYRIIYKPTGKTLYIGRSKSVGNRLGRHRLIFVNKGKDKKNPGGTTNPSAVGQNMYKFDTYRRHWMFSWCGVEPNRLTKKYEKKLLDKEQPLFNSKHLGGV